MRRWDAALGESLRSDGIIAVNFHRVPAENRAQAERRLGRIGELAVEQDRQIMIGFYDGYRETAFWGAEVCASLGLRAHYFPIFVGTISGQAGLDDDDLRRLADDHEIGFHTSSHAAAVEIDEANLDVEMLAPIRRISAITGSTPEVAAWRGGSRFDPTCLGDRTLRDLGVRRLVSNWSIEQIPPAGRPEDVRQ